MNNIDIIKEPEQLEERIKKIHAQYKELELKKTKIGVLLESEEKILDKCIQELKEFGLSIEEVPNFLNENIPKKVKIIEEFEKKIKEVQDFYDKNLAQL